MVQYFLLLLASSFGLSLILTPVLRTLAGWVGLVDHPDKHRKIHDRAVPVAGGIAIFLAAGIVLGAALFVPGPFRDHISKHGPRLFAVFLGCLIVCFVGVLDDRWALPGRHKLLGQLMAIGVVLSSDFVVRNVRLFGLDIQLGPLAVPFTAVWLLVGINSLNLLDGMDGFLGTVTVFLAAAFAGIALLGGQWASAGMALVLLGAVLGFLVYNFPRATIFLGDGGSMLLGLLVAVLAIQAMTGPVPTTWAPLVALAVMALPLGDTLAAIVRRKLTGRSVFTTDRGHLHHCLLRWGLSPRRVLLVVACLSLVAAGGALASFALKNDGVAILTLLGVATLLVVTRTFGYSEFILCEKRLWLLIVRQFLGKMSGKVQQMEVRLQGSIEWEELWRKLVQGAMDLDLIFLCLDVNAPAIHEGYYANWEFFGHRPEEGGGWQAEIPLEAWGPVVGHVTIRGPRCDTDFWHKIGFMATVIDEFETPGRSKEPKERRPFVVRLAINRTESGELETAQARTEGTAGLPVPH